MRTSTWIIIITTRSPLTVRYLGHFVFNICSKKIITVVLVLFCLLPVSNFRVVCMIMCVAFFFFSLLSNELPLSQHTRIIKIIRNRQSPN